jgi:ankyrin repeat protein
MSISLLQYGATINDQDDISGWTALMQATFYGHRAVARALIEQVRTPYDRLLFFFTTMRNLCNATTLELLLTG